MPFPVFKDEEFSIDICGDVTGYKYEGVFRAKQILTHAEQMEVDRLRRDLLGGTNQTEATRRAGNQAEIIADLMVRLTKSPEWWRDDARQGLALVDDNVLGKVHQEAEKIEINLKKALAEKAEKAREDLKKVTPSEG